MREMRAAILLMWVCVMCMPGWAAALLNAFSPGPCARFFRSSAHGRATQRSRLVVMSGLGDAEEQFGEAESMPVRRPTATTDAGPKKV